MKTIAVIAEYNPFHAGHAYHIRKSKEEAGNDALVVVAMSGDFVQRGEPAVFDKFTRAEAAVNGGADLVIEMPLSVSLSSAEGFARGAIRSLREFEPDILSFGSETGEINLLREIAAVVSEPDFIKKVKTELKHNPAQSFATARQHMAEESLGRKLPELQQPNNILAIEYLRFCGEITPLAVRRIGSGHDQKGKSDYPSASELRRCLREEGKGPEPALQEALLLDRLRRCSREILPPDSLGDSIFREIRRQESYEGILKACATRRYPLARVRRECLRAVLGVQDWEPAYLRVLAFNDRGRELLKKNTSLPVLTKPAHVKRLSEEARRQFQQTAEAHDFYQLMSGAPGPGEDWRTSPKCL